MTMPTSSGLRPIRGAEARHGTDDRLGELSLTRFAQNLMGMSTVRGCPRNSPSPGELFARAGRWFRHARRTLAAPGKWPFQPCLREGHRTSRKPPEHRAVITPRSPLIVRGGTTSGRKRPGADHDWLSFSTLRRLGSLRLAGVRLAQVTPLRRRRRRGFLVNRRAQPRAGLSSADGRAADWRHRGEADTELSSPWVRRSMATGTRRTTGDKVSLLEPGPSWMPVAGVDQPLVEPMTRRPGRVPVEPAARRAVAARGLHDLALARWSCRTPAHEFRPHSARHRLGTWPPPDGRLGSIAGLNRPFASPTLARPRRREDLGRAFALPSTVRAAQVIFRRQVRRAVAVAINGPRKSRI